MIVNASTTPYVTAANSQDYDSANQANTWNGLQKMVSLNSQLPLSVQKIIFLKSGENFINNLFLDWTGGTTSASDIELSMRDNSTTSGSFESAAAGTIPVFAFPAAAYGGTGRAFQVTLLRTGRFPVSLRIIDNGGNYSQFEMDWIIL